MNKAQKILLVLGVTVVMFAIFIVPYKVEKYDYYSGKILQNVWIEYHLIFTPPLDDDILVQYEFDHDYLHVHGWSLQGRGTWEKIYLNHNYPIKRKRDWILQASIIFGELVILSMLAFIFKTSKTKNQ